MQFINQYKGLPRQIYILLAARIISCIGMFVYPFLTLFLSSRIGMSEVKIGQFMLLVALINIPAVIIGGKLADRFTRKTTYLTAMLFSNIGLITTGFICDSMNAVYTMLFAFFFMNMSMPVLSAMMMDITDPKNRQESFSLIYLGINIGGAVGPMAAGFLFENYTQWLFWGEAGLNLIALSLIQFFIKDTKPDKEDYAEIAKDESRSLEAASSEPLLVLLLRSPIMICFAVCASALAFSYSQVSFMLPLQMEDVFGISAGAKYYGFLCSLNCIYVVLATPFLVLITKKLNPLVNMAISGILYTFGFGLYGTTDKLMLFYLFTLIWTTGEIVSATNTGVYIANHSPVTHRARFQSVFDMIQGTGRAVGPLLIGFFLVRHTINQAWALVGFICFASGIVLFILRAIEKHTEQ